MSNVSKLEFMLKLFKGRSDVYPVKWVDKRGNAGFSPTCKKKNTKACPKKRKADFRCSVCKEVEYLPFTVQVLESHVMGKVVVGVYPMLTNNKTHFAAVDFDFPKKKRTMGSRRLTPSRMPRIL